MSPFAFGRREGVQREKPLPSFTTDVTDEEDLEEIKKIRQMLNPNEEVFVVARQSRLWPGGSAFTPNVVFATDRRIIIKDPILLGMRENIIDIPYDMISSVRLDKGVFSSNIIFRAPGLTNSSPRGKLDKIMHRNGNTDWQGGGGNGMITAIPKNQAEELLEVIRNGIDRDREEYHQQQQHEPLSRHLQPVSIADELIKLAKLKEQGIISEDEFREMKQNLIRK